MRIIEALERRVLLNATVTSQFAPIQIAPNSTAPAIDLSTHFTDPTVTGSLVVLQTSQGNIFLNLFDAKTPKNVQNFLTYVNSGAYNNTVLQRATSAVLQGGGFDINENHIPENAAVQGEPGVSNTAGTIAMVLRTDPNTQQLDPDSATTDFQINVTDNTQLDAEKVTAFGQAIYNSMSVVSTIEGLPKSAVSPNFVPLAGDPPGGVLPLQNWNVNSPILPTNYVTINSAAQIFSLAFSVQSDNTNIVTPSVSGTTLSLTAGSTPGTAHVTINANDVGGNLVSAVLTVQVGQTQATLAKGAAKLVRFTDPDGTASQITYTGPGTATVSFTGVGLTEAIKGGVVAVLGAPEAVLVTAVGTSKSSNIIITGKGGNGTVDLATITADGSLHAIVAKNTAVTGGITVGGAVGSTILSSLTNTVFNIGAGKAATISIGTMNHASIFSDAPIQSVAVNSWANGGTMRAPSINKAAIKGTFVGVVSVLGTIKSFTAGGISSGNLSAGVVDSLVTHSISGWNASIGTLLKLITLGAISSSEINATANITSLSAASISNSKVTAGIAGGAFPVAITGFTTAQTIGSVKITGSYTNTDIAAETLSKLQLGAIQPGSTGAEPGVAGHVIKSLIATIGGKPLKLSNVTAQSQLDAALASIGVTSQQVVMNIF